MLIDYQMVFPADVVPRGARTERRIRASSSNVVEIPEAAEREVSHVLTARTAYFGSELYGIRDRDALEARIAEMLEDPDEGYKEGNWFTARGRLYKGKEMDAASFEAEVVRRGGILPYNGTRPFQEIHAVGPDDVREWNWDGRTEQAASERALASSYLRDGGNMMRRAMPPVWRISSQPHPAAACVSLDLGLSLQSGQGAGLLDCYPLHRFDRALEAAQRAAARTEGCYAVTMAVARPAPGVAMPPVDLEAIGVAMATTALLREIGNQAGRLSVPMVRQYLDLREHADAVFDLHAMDRLGTGAEFHRSDGLATVARGAAGLADATRSESKDLVAFRRNLATCLTRLERSPDPGPVVTAEGSPAPGRPR